MEEGAGKRQPLGHGRRRELLGEKPRLELVAVAGGDAPQRFVRAEELRQVPTRLLPDFQRRGLHVGSGQDVLPEEFTENNPLRGLD
jgi:hypothetical protein